MYPTFLQFASQMGYCSKCSKRTELCRIIDTHRMALLTSTKWRRTCSNLARHCLSCPVALHNIFHNPIARYSLFVLKVPFNTNQPTFCKEHILLLFTVLYCYLLGPRGTAADWCKSRTQQLTLVRRNPGHCKHRPFTVESRRTHLFHRHVKTVIRRCGE